MPQMMPLNWLTLMFYFILILMLFNCLNYYSFMYTNKISKSMKNKISLNWKW